MRLKGYSGYYLSGKIVRNEKNQALEQTISFGYKTIDIGIITSDSIVQGVESSPTTTRIEVMGDCNPFRRFQRVEICGETYIVTLVSSKSLGQLSKEQITTVEAQKN